MSLTLQGTGPLQLPKDSTIGGQKLGCLSDEIVVNSDSTFVASQIGSLIVGVPTVSFTSTLPLANSVPKGAQINLYCSSGAAGIWTIQRQGSDILEGVQNLLPYFQLTIGDTAVLESNGAATWRVVGGSASLRTSGDFRYNLVSNGWQKLPSGLIIQWGSYNAPTNSTTTLSLPIVFPNNFFSIMVSVEDDLGTVTSFPFSAAKKVSNSQFSLRSYYQQSNIRSSWMAVGN